MVTVYTLPACVQCDTTKRFLKTNFIEFQEINLAEDPEAHKKVTEWGFSQAPVVEAGDERWSGFRLEKLRTIAA